jgi:photosystem II stability/assembly factor-like uncharacterized protein
MKPKDFLLSVCILAGFLSAFFIFARNETRERFEQEGHALEAFDYWYNQRALPGNTIPQGAFLRATTYAQQSIMKERALQGAFADTTTWRSIGPDNVGGRILAIAVNPVTPNIIWAGSASGGLWKSTSRGVGASAWMLVNTGYPTLAVSSVVIDPGNTNVMYIGTGEVGGAHSAAQVGTPGARATYGMGVLKSIDAGASWSLTGLVFSFPQITAVQKVILNPLNTATVYAATTEGTYKSTDAGTTWNVSNPELMTMDIIVNPVDTTILYASHGQRSSTPNPGIYKTTDAGASWTRLTNGLPASNLSGRTALSLAVADPRIVYAGISHASSSALLGLYRTFDGGDSWSAVSGIPNYVGGQGWYDNCVAIHPNAGATIFLSGLDIYRTTNAFFNVSRMTNWAAGFGYVVPPGGPEGPSNYAHADHHAIAFDPTDPSLIYFGTDGGVFASTDGGSTYEGRNGGLITTQFYNGFGFSEYDTTVAIGGLQDNGTVKYSGGLTWSKVYGGDGGWCAVNPADGNFMYEEYVYLAMSKSEDAGATWYGVTSGLPTGSSNANFIAPFVIAPSAPDILYAGAKNVYKSTNGALSWSAANGGSNFNGAAIAVIGVSYSSSDSLMAGTGRGSGGFFEIFRSENGGASWTKVDAALPNRYPTDISYDANDSRVVYLTFSGYGTSHVFRTSDHGQTWADISSNLPDIPVQSIVVDPAFPSTFFIGTDLGVFRTVDGGASWHDYNNGMPPAMVTDVTIPRTARLLRASTFGNGVYERTLPPTPASVSRTVDRAWNLVSMPARVPDARASQVFPSSNSSAFRYAEGYVVEETLRAGRGYWMKFPSTGVVRISGGEMKMADTIEVVKGWNLIGSIAKPVSVASVTSEPGGIIASPAFGYSDGYAVRDTLRPVEAYWMKMNDAGVIILR